MIPRYEQERLWRLTNMAGSGCGCKQGLHGSAWFTSTGLFMWFRISVASWLGSRGEFSRSLNSEAAEGLGLSLASYILSLLLHSVDKVSPRATSESRGGEIGSTSQWKIGNEFVIIFNPSSLIIWERQSFEFQPLLTKMFLKIIVSPASNGHSLLNDQRSFRNSGPLFFVSITIKSGF